MTDYFHWTAGLYHDGSTLYVSNPLPSLGETVRVRLRTPAHVPIQGAFLRTVPDGEPHIVAMTPDGGDSVSTWYAADLHISMPVNPYRFRILTEHGAYNLNALGVSRAEGPDGYDFKLLADFAAPTWVYDAVFYQIFPDRFCNGDPTTDVPEGAWTLRGFSTQRREWGKPPLPFREGGNLDYYGGDLAGIAQKIEYLCDLGVNALYLTPIFSAKSNHRYDVADYEQVDPYLGGNEALSALRRALDAAGMHLILDITLNHCGWQNHWFLAAQADPRAPTAEYFTFHEHPHNYLCWLGHKSLPKLNYRSRRLRETLYGGPEAVLRLWLREPYRIDGWRLDVANMQARQGEYQMGNEVGREIRASVKAERPDAYVFGEHFYDGTPHLQGDELDASMNYQGFTFPVWRWLTGHDLGVDTGRLGADRALLPAEALTEQWTRFRAAVPWVVAQQQYNLLCSHDTPRIMRIVQGDKALAKLAAVLLLTYLGVPSIYYGDEVGLDGGADPDNRRCMPWDSQEWDHDLREHYKKLIALRRTAPALRYGGFQHLYAFDGLLAYQRQSREQRLIVIGHRGPGPLDYAAIPVRHGGLADGVELVDLLAGGTYRVEQGAIRVNRLTRGMALILEAH